MVEVQSLSRSASDERRAAHEGGHSLVACVVNWPFHYVTIDYDERHPAFVGHVAYTRTLQDHHSGVHPWSGVDIFRWMVAFSSGRYGEIALLGSSGRGSEADDATILDIMRYVKPDPIDREADIRGARDASRSIVMAYREALRTIARELVEDRRLTYEQIEAIVQESVPADVLETFRAA